MRATRAKSLLCSAAIVAAAAVLVPASPAGAATATLDRVAPGFASYEAGRAGFSGVGTVTAGATFVDVQIPPSPTPNTSTSGCEAADFAGFPAGKIAVIQRGVCVFSVKALNAQAAGASAVVFFNEGQPGRTDLFPVSLSGPGVTIPVVVTTFAAGQELFSLGGSGLTLRVAVTANADVCAAPPTVGSAYQGKNPVVAQPGAITVGTDGADVIYGTSGPDRITALGGDDVVFGFGGEDLISGGGGTDTLCGGDENDRLFGDAGDDVLSGDSGNDDLSGGAGDDTLLDHAGTNRVTGDGGNDFCSPYGAPASQAACETTEDPVAV